MELINKNDEKMIWKAKLNISLANALRRSVGNIPVLAISECDIYKNDTVLYDEVIAHRLGLVPLKNQKVKKGEIIELKLKQKAKEGEKVIVEAGELGELVVYPEMPIALLANKQELEIVARAEQGIGQDHAKFMPGLMFYKEIPKIKIEKAGEAHIELSEHYPGVFEFKEKLTVKDAWKADLDMEDLEKYEGVSAEYTDELVFIIESWGQMKAESIFTEAASALKNDLEVVLKALK